MDEMRMKTRRIDEKDTDEMYNERRKKRMEEEGRNDVDAEKRILGETEKRRDHAAAGVRAVEGLEEGIRKKRKDWEMWMGHRLR